MSSLLSFERKRPCMEALPWATVSSFDCGSDRGWYSWEARKGQEVEGRSLFLPWRACNFHPEVFKKCSPFQALATSVNLLAETISLGFADFFCQLSVIPWLFRIFEHEFCRLINVSPLHSHALCFWTETILKTVDLTQLNGLLRSGS